MKDVIDYRHLLMGRVFSTAVPDMIAEWARDNAGRPLRSNNIPDGFRIEKFLGSTRLARCTRALSGATREDDERDWSFLLARHDKHVQVPSVETLRRLNPGLYAGAEEHNADVKARLEDPARLEQEFLVFSEMRTAAAAYREALRIFNEMFDNHPAIYPLKKLAGVIEER